MLKVSLRLDATDPVCTLVCCTIAKCVCAWHRASVMLCLTISHGAERQPSNSDLVLSLRPDHAV